MWFNLIHFGIFLPVLEKPLLIVCGYKFGVSWLLEVLKSTSGVE